MPNLTKFDHKVVDVARVYLVWDDGEWDVDQLTVDSEELDAELPTTVSKGTHCELHHEDSGDEVAEDCAEAIQHATATPLPRAKDLVVMIASKLDNDELMDVIMAMHREATRRG